MSHCYPSLVLHVQPSFRGLDHHSLKSMLAPNPVLSYPHRFLVPTPSVAVPGLVTHALHGLVTHALETPTGNVASGGQQSPGLLFHESASLPGYSLPTGAAAQLCSLRRTRLAPPSGDTAVIIRKEEPSRETWVVWRGGWAEPEPLGPVISSFVPICEFLCKASLLPSCLTPTPLQASIILSFYTYYSPISSGDTAAGWRY